MYEVEITIKTNEFLRVKVTDKETRKVHVGVPQHFKGDWEEHGRMVANEMISDMKKSNEIRVVTYTVE